MANHTGSRRACTFALVAVLALPASAAMQSSATAEASSPPAAASPPTAAASTAAVTSRAAPAPAGASASGPAVPASVASVGGAGSSSNANGQDDTQFDDAQQALLTKAIDLIKASQFEAAITGPLDAVIAAFESKFGHDTKTRYYSVRSTQEALLYMGMAATEDKRNATALDGTWQEAYFLKGSALNSLGRYDEASKALAHALSLAPMNAQSMIELAFSYSHVHKTADALELCQSAEAMSAFSPDDLQTTEKARALRCEGFNLTDLHRYNEAIGKYQAALKLNPDDAISKRELEYIKQQEAARP